MSSSFHFWHESQLDLSRLVPAPYCLFLLASFDMFVEYFSFLCLLYTTLSFWLLLWHFVSCIYHIWVALFFFSLAHILWHNSYG